MWILIKLILSLVAFLFRFRGRLSDFENKKKSHLNGIPYFLKFDYEQINKSKMVKTTYLGFEIDSNAIFEITEESRWDIFFKAIGFSEEFQTGDQLFDKHFYISSDNPAVKRLLRSEETVRAEMMNLFTEGCLKIYSSRSVIWFKFSGNVAVKDGIVSLCNNLQEKMAQALKREKHYKLDPFAFKTFVIEGGIYSLAIYSIAGLFEIISSEADIYLHPFALVRLGTIVGIAATIILVFLVYLLMKGSSRSHRIIIESAIVLGLSLPIGSFIAVGDINIKLDRSHPRLIPATVNILYMEKHRSRSRRGIKGRYYYSYHMDITTQTRPAGRSNQAKIKITKSLYSRLTAGRGIIIRVKDGYLQVPWIEDIYPQ